jgi:hypothetical protein
MCWPNHIQLMFSNSKVKPSCPYIQFTVDIHLTIFLSDQAKKKKCVFTVTCQKNLWSVGRSALLSSKREIVVSDSGISFSKFPVSRHLLKLFYDELRSFYTPRNEVVGGYTGFTMSVRL